MNSQFRADHIGSFLRAPELIEAHRNRSAPEAIRGLEDKHILRVLDKQRELGFGIFTDGEFRRQNFMSDFIDAVNGFDISDAVSRSWEGTEGATTAVRNPSGIVIAKLSQRRPLTAHEAIFLCKRSPGPVKITLLRATQFPAISFKPGITDRVYPNRSALPGTW
jgi:5-methyltetrahydropteroyltriglutamate--homocysteine methyltransferase